MNTIHQSIIETPIGKLKIHNTNKELFQIDFLHNTKTPPKIAANPLSKSICKQLHQYFDAKTNKFNLTLSTSGTPFQQRVWKQMQKIPYGETRTYGELAEILNSSARAVGNACRKNPIPVIIPCHRVVAKAGIGGFSGKTQGRNINVKKTLLAIEQR